MAPSETPHLRSARVCHACEKRKVPKQVKERLHDTKSPRFKIKVNRSPRRKRTISQKHHACRKCQKHRLTKSVLARLQDIQDLAAVIEKEFLQLCGRTLAKFEDAESNGPAPGVRCSLQYMCLDAKYHADTKGIYKHAKDFLFNILVDQYWSLWTRLYRYKNNLGSAGIKATVEERKVLREVLTTDEHSHEGHAAIYVKGWKDMTLGYYSLRLSCDGKKATADEKRDLEEILKADVANAELFEAYQASIVAELRRHSERLKEIDDWLEGGVDPAELDDQETTSGINTGASSTIHSYNRSISDCEFDHVLAPVYITDVLDMYYDAKSVQGENDGVDALEEVAFNNQTSASLPSRPSTPLPPTIGFTEISAVWLECARSAGKRGNESDADVEIEHLKEATRPLYEQLYRYKKRFSSSSQMTLPAQRRELHRASLCLWHRLCRLYRGHDPNRQEAWAHELAYPVETFKDLFRAYWPLWCHFQRYKKEQATDGKGLAEGEERDLEVLLELIREAYCYAWCRYRRQKGLDLDGNLTAAEQRRDLVEVLSKDMDVHGEEDSEESNGNRSRTPLHDPSTAGRRGFDTATDDRIPCIFDWYRAKPDSHDDEVAAALQSELEKRSSAAVWAPRPRTLYPLAIDFTESVASWLEGISFVGEHQNEAGRTVLMPKLAE